MKRIVWITRVNSRNFISDFGAELKNIIGGRLSAYEKMVNHAIEQASKDLYEAHPSVEDVKVQITEFGNRSICVTIYGVAEC